MSNRTILNNDDLNSLKKKVFKEGALWGHYSFYVDLPDWLKDFVVHGTISIHKKNTNLNNLPKEIEDYLELHNKNNFTSLNKTIKVGAVFIDDHIDTLEGIQNVVLMNSELQSTLRINTLKDKEVFTPYNYIKQFIILSCSNEELKKIDNMLPYNEFEDNTSAKYTEMSFKEVNDLILENI